MTPEDLEQIEFLVRKIIREEKKRDQARERQRRFRERNANVTQRNAFPQANVTQRNAPQGRNGDAKEEKDLFPLLSPPHTPPLTPPLQKKNKPCAYVTRSMVEYWCKKKNCSKLVDAAWGRLLGSRYYGVLIKTEPDFNAAMAAIREEWLKTPL